MLKKFLYVISILAILVFFGYIIIDEPLPEGSSGPRAEQLADKMLDAINYDAWIKTKAVSWSFPRGHHFIWDKSRNFVKVSWDDYDVLLNINDHSGIAYENGNQLSLEKTDTLLKDAWKLFANDSFWMFAPFKIRDPETERRYIKLEDHDGLVVHYKSGGVTPGDTYLWTIGDDGLPLAWQMWVRIIPVGGLKFTWENWKQYPTGVVLSDKRDGIIDINLTNIKVANNIRELNNGTDPFVNLQLLSSEHKD